MFYAVTSWKLGLLYQKTKEYEKAMLPLLNAEQIFERIDTGQAIEVLTSMAEIDNALGNHAGAQTWLNRATELSQP